MLEIEEYIAVSYTHLDVYKRQILHLMRGEIFNIDNKSFFTFGGAKSHDIQEGILNLDEEEKIMKQKI